MFMSWWYGGKYDIFMSDIFFVVDKINCESSYT